MQMRAQGANEYLVLLAVVLIVALVGVALLIFSPGTASDSQMAQSQTYWSGQAKPFRVIEATSSAETMCGVAWAHGYALVIQNMEAETLTVTGISADGSTGFCLAGGTANASVTMGPSDKKNFYVMTSSGDSPCTLGQIAQMDLNITYRTAFIASNRQAGSKKLMLRCSTDSINVSANATGGNVTQNGSFRMHTFTSSGTFTANQSMNVEVLVVAGGGGGSVGGGGAGGLIYNPSYSLTAGQVVTVTVGAGGAGRAYDTYGSSGSNSVFGTLTAIGGGGGGRNYAAGVSGGSGGGGGSLGVVNGGSGVSGQGNAGGANPGAGNPFPAGGGGGAGAAGYSPVDGVGGNGGAGLDMSSYFGTSVGAAGWFAGGGGGKGYNGGQGGTGGQGGGGYGGNAGYQSGTDGTPGTGGGGGGGAYWNVGRSGGSGVVIVRYY